MLDTDGVKNLKGNMESIGQSNCQISDASEPGKN